MLFVVIFQVKTINFVIKPRAIRVSQIMAFSPLWSLLEDKKFKVLNTIHSIIVFLKACTLTLAALLSTSYGNNH